METESRTCRQLARCRADFLIWRDRKTSDTYDDADSDVARTQYQDCLIKYNRTEQSLRVRRSLSRDPFLSQDLEAARIGAFLHLPFLHPIGPIPMGAVWQRNVGEEASMRFQLVEESRVGEARVVLIKKDGEFSGRAMAQSAVHAAARIKRRGLTVFAIDRSVVLEDRVSDCYEFQDPSCPSITVTNVCRLIRSRLDSMTDDSAVNQGQ